MTIKNLKLKWFLFLMLLMFNVPIIAHASTSPKDISNVKNTVNNIIINYSRNFKESSWNNSSKINNIIPLHDLNNKINGYIFEITTNGKETGFIQIDTSAGTNNVSRFSFNGKHELNYMLAKNKPIVSRKAKKQMKLFI